MYYRIPPITNSLLRPMITERPSEDEYVDKIADRFQKDFKIIEANTEIRIEYRELTCKEASTFKVCDRVLVFLNRRTKGVSLKLLPAYNLPFVAEKVLSWSIYRVESED